MIKEAGFGTDAAKFVGDVGGKAFDLAVKAADRVDQMAWILVPTLGVLGTIGAIHALTPKAVAKNADKYIISDALWSSLGVERRRQLALSKLREEADKYNEIRKHDRFV